MDISYIAKVYWRRIKAGTRTFSSIKGDDVKAEVLYLAQQDLAKGVITQDQFNELTKDTSKENTETAD